MVSQGKCRVGHFVPWRSTSGVSSPKPLSSQQGAKLGDQLARIDGLPQETSSRREFKGRRIPGNYRDLNRRRLFAHPSGKAGPVQRAPDKDTGSTIRLDRIDGREP